MTHDLALLCVVVGALGVVVPPAHGLARHAVTAVHEVGHAVVALCVGRTLSTIRINRDASGEAVSVGRARGPGVVLTLAAGYPAPTLVGLGGLASVRAGRVELWIVVMVAVLAVMVLVLRGAFGFVVVATMLVGLVAVLHWARPETGAVVVASFSWFLVFGALRSTLDLWGHDGTQSDAHALRQVTGVPAVFWVCLFVVLAAGGALVAARLAELWPSAWPGSS